MDEPELAEQVATALRRAGLVVLDRDEYGGAKVETAADAGVPGPGALVSWNPSLELVDIVVERMREGTDDPGQVSETGHVREAMQPALIGVLRAAGYAVEECPDAPRPSAVLVTGTLTGTSRP